MGSGGRRKWPASFIQRLAQPSRRMLRQMDARRKILRLCLGKPDLGLARKNGRVRGASETISTDFQSSFFVVAAAQQGREEIVCGWPNVPWRVDALRCEIATALAVPGRHFRRICRLFQERAMGCVR